MKQGGLCAYLALLLLAGVSASYADMVVTKGSGHRPPPRRVSPSRKPPTAPTTYKSILALAAARKDLSIANAVLKKTAGPDFGPNAPPATVFLPNDEAFKLLLKALGVTQAQLLALPTKVLTEVIVYHAVPGMPLAAKDLKPKQVVETALPGYNLTITKDSAGVMILAAQSKAKVVTADLKAGMTIVHIVDTVLVPFDVLNPPVPPGAFDTPGGALTELGLEYLVGAIEAAGLGGVLNRTDVIGTLFAPTNDAIIRTQTALANNSLGVNLMYPQVVQMILGDHVHLGEKLMAADVAMRSTIPVGWAPADYATPDAHILTVTFNPAGPSVTLSGFPGNSAKVIKADVLVGTRQELVVHVVDGVLITTQTARALGLIQANGTTAPVPTPAPTPAPSPSSSGTGTVPVSTVPNLGAAIATTPDLSQLLSKALAAGLGNQVATANSPLTMFAPNNAAWAAFESMLNAKDPRLTAVANQIIALIISDHVHVGDSYNANALTNGQIIPIGMDPTKYMDANATTVRVTVNATGVFLAHQVSGAKVLRTILAGPTVVNIIDSVLLSRASAAALGLIEMPSASPTPTPTPVPTPSPVAGDTILGVISADISLAGIGQLIALTGLAEPLSDPDIEYTLFAPVNDAVTTFAAELQKIQTYNPANPQVLQLLYQILATHVYMAGVLRSSDLTDGQVIRTGVANTPATNVTVTINSTGVFLTATNTVKVIAADIAAGKSIVHKLDGVLVSPEVARLIVELSAGGGASPAPSPSGTPSSANYSSVLAALSSNTDLIGFNGLLGITGALQQLSSPNLVATFFAPTNEAIEQAGDLLASLGTNPVFTPQIQQIVNELLGSHIHLGEALTYADLNMDGKKIPVGLNPAAYTAADNTVLTVIANSTGVYLQSTNIVMVSTTTLTAGKSIIHVIDGVIVSPKLLAMLPPPGSSPAPTPASTPGEEPAQSPSPSPSAGPASGTFSDVRQALTSTPDLFGFNGLLTGNAVVYAQTNNPNLVATIFAPSNAALENSEAITSLAAGAPDTTQILLRYNELLGSHIHIGEALTYADLNMDGKKIPVGLNPATYTAADNTVLTVIANSTGVYLQSGNIVMVSTTTITAGKSIIHIIDDVIVSTKLLSLLSGPSATPSPSPSPEPADPTYDDLPSALRGQGFNHLADLYDAAVNSAVGPILQSLLSAPITLFAPSDTSIDEYLSSQSTTFEAFLADSKTNPINIAGLVLPHIHIGHAYTLDEFTVGQVITTSTTGLEMFGAQLTVQEHDAKVVFSTSVGPVTVIGGIIRAGTGIIIPIDKVLKPDV
ncbi:hypothetical protein CHLRE_06g278170v5 [Chlamydomonas reinhardtii]|uniref:FAS1 domain-containing protein n=1 Tax=Chlamydomonas reinhardtii TaxID=3055 RepID=A0A2K3DP33_CHLRE|nr:uncharacterized protein CHLRE_06g278170v5 [Chlamydomonas reinhardtii]PNW82278.1 hypothetical protein CHLRE_06g278170v5 [Chlamydomonas reinhardtii]